MSITHIKHQRFLDIGLSADLQEFESRLAAFTRDLGFQYYAAGRVTTRPGQAFSTRFIDNIPSGYRDAAHDSAAVRRDPVIQRLKSVSIPFTYDQALYVREGAGDLWEHQAQFGFKNGISVALHLPSHEHFLLGLDRIEPIASNDRRKVMLLAELQLLAVYAQGAALRLVAPAPVGALKRNLSARELEVLRWTMEGKSAWEIGEILHISERTVNFHVERIKDKLNASTKAQAVIEAMRLDLL